MPVGTPVTRNDFSGIDGSPGISGGDIVRKEYEDEKNRADEKQGGEKPEVAERRGLERHEGEKGADRGYVSYDKRGNYLLHRSPPVTSVGEMGDKVQGVVHGDAQNHARYAYDNQRHAVPEKGHPPEGEQQTPADRKEGQEDVPHGAERIEEQEQNQHCGQADGKDAVFLDSFGVAHGDGGSAGYVYFDVREVFTHLTGGLFQNLQQPGVVLGLAVPER